MINDIDKDVSQSSKFSLFADDTRVMRPVSSEDAVEELQSDLDVIYNWQKESNMIINSKKFKMLRYGRQEDLKESTNYLTPDFEDLIEVKESLRDLGGHLHQPHQAGLCQGYPKEQLGLKIFPIKGPPFHEIYVENPDPESY